MANRNTENHFDYAPMVNFRERSKFNRDTGRTMTFSAGKLYPFYWDEILPGDTVKLNTKAVVRMLTPLFPTMDMAYLDIYWFYRPERILWTHFPEFLGENKLTAWEQPTEYERPKIIPPEGGWNAKTLADYMEIPPGVEQPDGIIHEPFRMYCEIWNQFFRDQNLKDRAMWNDDDTTLTGTNSGDYVTNAQLGGTILPVAKYKDYFTSALPRPAKGPEVIVPSNPLPIIGRSEWVSNNRTKYSVNDTAPMFVQKSTWNNSDPYYTAIDSIGNATRPIAAERSTGATGFTLGGTGTSDLYTGLVPTNLWADTAYGIGTINELRTAFAIQRVLEAMARGGSRYRELMLNIWNQQIPDSTLQIPEFLGGSRQSLNIDQVLQVSETSSDGTPLGETGAFSNTWVNQEGFVKSFSEHGYIMGVLCVRTKNSYQQGIAKKWTRHTRYDGYMPQFAYLGEMPIKNREIYAQGTSADNETFGFQEAWAEYRYNPSQIMGEMRSSYTQSLDAWHYADDYASLPTLSSEWIDSNAETLINRSLAIQSNTGDQFLANIKLEIEHVRQMPLYSIPGLIDHY